MANIPLIPRNTCQEHFHDLNVDYPIGEDVICAGDYIPAVEQMEKKQNDLIKDINNNNDACLGDSGGPLLYFDLELNTWFQLGVISRGLACGLNPGVYAKVSTITDWLVLE